MSRRNKKKSKGKPRLRPTLWCREALSLARLIPPKEVAAQACWACGHEAHLTMFGWLPKLYEIYDSYGRLVMCQECIKWHLSQLGQDNTTPAVEQQVKPHRELMTYDEWLDESTIEDMQDVLDRMKARMKARMKK
jgi:hypothetical protein